jgi:hypothetical protein
VITIWPPPDEPGLLEQPRRHGDTGAVDTEHHRQELLRHRELVTARPVMRHQQPARQALVERLVAIAGGGLRHLRLEGERVAEQQRPQRRALLDRLAEGARAEPQQGGAGHWTMASTALRSLPSRRGRPTMPSEPTTPTSADRPSARRDSIKTQPFSGKWAAGMGSSGACRT